MVPLLMLLLVAKNLAAVFLQMCYLNGHLGWRIYILCLYSFIIFILVHTRHLIAHKYIRSHSVLKGFEIKMFLYKYCRKQSDISSIVLSLSYLDSTEMVVADTENKFSNFQLCWPNKCLKDTL